ncbi:MAG TPA: enoyl-CoA hydratase-related protein, partial [Egibacteraceae bacterium]
ILAMACDHVVAAAGDFKWGLLETTIGFPMPRFVLDIAERTVRADRLDDLVLSGTLLTPEEAVEAGFADVVVPAEETVAAAQERAAELAALPRHAYAATKRRLRGAAAERATRGLVEDVAALLSERAGG